MHSSAIPDSTIQRAVDGLRELILAVDHYRQLLAERDGLTLSQISALSYLRSRGDLGQTALAASLGLTTGSTTTLVDRLEGAGWVNRLPHPRDRRRTIIHITEQGERFVEQVREQFGHSLACIRAEDLDIVAAALTGIGHNLSIQTDSRPLIDD